MTIARDSAILAEMSKAFDKRRAFLRGHGDVPLYSRVDYKYVVYRVCVSATLYIGRCVRTRGAVVPGSNVCACGNGQTSRPEM